MASLSFIMDVTDDHHHTAGRAHLNKRERGANNLTSAGQLHEAAPPSPEAGPGHVSSPGLATTEQDINPAAPAGPTKRRGVSSRGPKSAAAASQAKIAAGTEGIATVSPSTSSSPPLSAPKTRKSARRRRSTTSNDSMDRPRYGSARSSSSMGGGLQRPMPLHSPAAEYAPKITPKTGRVSKAKKGLPVHVCDICRPPKTFTRAEHLRRHQLGHGAPQFQCPGCDRSFHRADLLARHQQKHEHDGDDMSRAGSAQQSPHPSPAALAFQAQHSPRTPAAGPAASPAATEIPPTPNAAVGTQSSFPQASNSAHGSSAAAYRAAPRATSQDFHNSYTFSPTISIVNPAQSSSYHGSLGGYQPRSGPPPPIYVVTQDLQPPSLQQTDLPGLHDPSPMPSSASDSTYSTPASDVSRNPRPWVRGHRSPYPSTTPRGLQSSGPGIEASPSLPGPLYINSSYSNHQQQPEHTFGGTIGVPSPMVYSTAGAGHHHPSLSASSSGGTIHAPQHQHSSPLSSLRGQTPPLDTSSHGADSLLVSAPRLSGHLGSMVDLDRRKGAVMESHHDLLSSEASMGLNVLGGLAVEYAAASPGDNASHSSGIVAELDLALGDGCALPGHSSMTIPLPGPVRAAIPRYLDIYWAQVDPVLPLIHRQTFEAAPEDVLKCAMAAVATQHLDNREDRTRGNQLHEFAWQEVKRIPQWSLQTMQAILLCEYFARFRGRKAVTRPSKPFESLYSRVLYQNPDILDHAMLAVEQQHLSSQDRWHSWIDIESRRRLLAACLFSDGHAAIYQQQRRAQDGEADASLQLIPLFGRSTKLWESTSAKEWDNILAANPGELQPEHVPLLEHLTHEDVARRPPIDRMIILSALAQRLPRRQRPLPATSLSANNSPAPELDPHTHHMGSQFSPDQQPTFLRHHQPHHQHHHAQPDPHLDGLYPFDAEERINALFPACPIANTYLALHHTPLRDLLAVGGDSWVFSQKVLPATSFHEHQKRLKMWVTCTTTTNGSGGSNGSGPLASLNVLRATVYASRAILGFLDREARPHQHQQHHPSSGVGSNPAAPWSADMSDYWALYVCALICWAFGHPAARGGAGGGGVDVQGQGQGQNGGGSRQRSTSSGSGRDSSPAAALLLLPNGAAAAAASRPGSGGASTAGDEEAVAWLRMVAGAGARLEDVVRARGRREAAGVVGLVRKRLESDCVGGRSRLYVDAVGVLRKVEEGVGWKWF
ncbi:hypothetical protein C8A01DRAFT_33299 [Parachaetomium inaequale]|uniref:C2H2-type domain-containing protein n=1 Tax=Parachaetomium inaequale TaxID=2588326 RepID=A0AAN6SUE0_9PEZI|nr:hypothetical protein C8A01DRAFT_33299 [Parachaetomium inaequale]